MGTNNTVCTVFKRLNVCTNSTIIQCRETKSRFFSHSHRTERCLRLCFSSKFNALFRIWLPATIPQSEHTSTWCNSSARASEREQANPFYATVKIGSVNILTKREKERERERDRKREKQTTSIRKALTVCRLQSRSVHGQTRNTWQLWRITLKGSKAWAARVKQIKA